MKCKHCGVNHKNRGGESEVCFNCEFVETRLNEFVSNMNKFKPTIGNPRKLEIIKFKISK